MISEEYQKQLVDLHKSPVFGNKKEIPAEVSKLIDQHNITSILDFGCGKGLLIASIKEQYPNIEVYGFDPADPINNTLPKNVDMIMSFDVLEHVEPTFINDTLSDLKNRCNKIMHHVIACHPAKRVLNDGRNAHLIIENPDWWKIKISEQIGWSILDENVISYTSNPKKGKPIEVVKYLLTLKNGKS
jgi:SAM-dependent methyltransferase